jgi:hypothetical protein
MIGMILKLSDTHMQAREPAPNVILEVQPNETTMGQPRLCREKKLTLKSTPQEDGHQAE